MSGSSLTIVEKDTKEWLNKSLNKINVWGVNLKYNYGIAGSTDKKLLKQIIEIVVTVIVIILVLAAVIRTAQFTTDLNTMIMFGNRSQKICGDNYMEYESARNKLYVYYTSSGVQKKIQIIKKLLGISLMLIMAMLVVSLIFLIILGIIDNATSKLQLVKVVKVPILLFNFFVAIFLAVFLVLFFIETKKTVLENTYGESETEKRVTPYLIAILILIFLAYIGILSSNSIIQDKTPTMLILIIPILVIVTFMFIMNINTKKINDKFIKKYEDYSTKINSALCILGQKDNATISRGVDENMPVSNWINKLLTRNINRVRPEDGMPNLDFKGKCDDTQNNPYFNTMYAYLENSQGKELQELPDNNKIIQKQANEIRKNMWRMRNENNEMLNPVKKFVRQIRIFILIVLFVLSFIIYHVSYMNYPKTTKLTLVGIILIFTLFLMYSVIL